MLKRRLGSSELEVGEIALGTWALSGEAYGPMDEATARDLLRASLDEGVTLIDTAPCYGEDGAVESLIGTVLKERGREAARVCTRIGVLRTGDGGARKLFTPQALRAGLEMSLKRLQTDHVDVVLLHNPLAQTIRTGEALGTLQELKKAGKAKLVGVSFSTAEAGRAALEHPIDVVGLPYNALHSRLLHTIAGDVSRKGAAVLAYSPLAYGLLTGSWDDNREFGYEDHRSERWTRAEFQRRVRQREAVRVLVKGPTKDMREAAVRYVLANRLVSAAVVGARTPAQARENAHAADEQPYLDPEAFGRLTDRLLEEGIAV